ncbi:MAG TPA: phospholipase D family protein, partial [Geminicoccaceae bacterium]
MEDLFDPATRPPPARPDAEPERGPGPERILAFDIALRGARETAWRDLFQGFGSLKALTFSASVPAILDVAALFDDVEITFGSERVLSRELAALEHATAASGYRFTDALADQKAFIERFVRPALSRRGTRLLERVQDGSLRFRLLRAAPSHAKLYLLAGEDRFRAIAGSANLSLAAFSGRQRETFFVADGEADYLRFLDYYAEDEACSDPIDADLLIVTAEDGDAASLDV